MKKTLSLIFALMLCLALCACTQTNVESPSTNPTVAPNATAPNTTSPTEPSIPSEHAHDWAEATCTEPKTCKTCGATEGVANEHAWQDASCNEPATCTLCGAVSGDALGHNFEGGDCATPPTCTLCGEVSSENGDHSFYGGICRVCGATNERYDEIKSALKAAERYPKYININYDLIDNEYDLFNATKDPDYFNDAHEHVLEIYEYLQKIIDKCEDYSELNMLTNKCRDLLLEMPTVPASATTSAMRSYISDARSFARKCKDVAIIYNVLSDDYGLPGV